MVNASGVFAARALACPEEPRCERCAAPLHAAPFAAPANLTALRVVSCRYRADACEMLRAEVKTCARRARALCGERDARVEAKSRCRREVNRAWRTRCKETRTALVMTTERTVKRFASALERLRGAKRRRAEGGAGEDATALEVELSRLKTSVADAYESVKNNDGGIAIGGISRRMRAFTEGPTSLDSLADVSAAIAAMEAVAGELETLSSEARNVCSRDASMDTEEAKITCETIEEKMQLSEKRVNRCAARLSDFMVSTAKIDALVAEQKRRFALLDSLDAFAESFTGAWNAAAIDVDVDGSGVRETSAGFNLTEHVASGVVDVLLNEYAASSARRSLATAEVPEDALCAQLIPRLQLSLLGAGLNAADLVCPPPHGTFIAGRELPDWSAYFLFLFGVALGVAVAVSTNHASEGVAFIRRHASVVVAVLVVVLAGRFFDGAIERMNE